MKKLTAFLIGLSVVCAFFSGCAASANTSEIKSSVKPLPDAITDKNYNRLQTITVFGQQCQQLKVICQIPHEGNQIGYLGEKTLR